MIFSFTKYCTGKEQLICSSFLFLLFFLFFTGMVFCFFFFSESLPLLSLAGNMETTEQFSGCQIFAESSDWSEVLTRCTILRVRMFHWSERQCQCKCSSFKPSGHTHYVITGHLSVRQLRVWHRCIILLVLVITEAQLSDITITTMQCKHIFIWLNWSYTIDYWIFNLY